MFRNNLNILVVGDLMLDRFVYGSVDRISPEAPVPVFKTNGKDIETLGGAGNVVNNLVSLGCIPDVISIVGKDKTGRDILNKLETLGVNSDLIELSYNKSTSLKTRYVSGSHHIVRIDTESTDEEEYKNDIKKFYDIAIISDYAKGVVTPKLMRKIDKCSRISIVDPSPNSKYYYEDLYPQNTSIITPNFKEAIEMEKGFLDGEEPSDSIDFIRRLLQRIGMTSFIGAWGCNVVMTDGSNGLWVWDFNKLTRIPAEKVEVFDVSGAGDTVVSVLALAIASEYTLLEAAKLANKAAGIVVSKSGTSTVSLEDLKR